MRGLVCGVLAALWLGVVVPGASAAVAGHARYAIGSSAVIGDAGVATRHNRVFILHAWQMDRLRALKAADPSVTVLVYKELAAMNDFARVGGVTASGVGFDEASSVHPEWFLTTAAGQRFTFGSYGFLWAADVGDPGYQQRWAEEVLDHMDGRSDRPVGL